MSLFLIYFIPLSYILMIERWYKPSVFIALWYSIVHGAAYIFDIPTSDISNTYIYSSLIFMFCLCFWVTINKITYKKSINTSYGLISDKRELDHNQERRYLNMAIFLIFLCLVYTSIFFYERAVMILELINSEQKIGARTDFAYAGDSIFENVYLQELTLTMMYIYIILLGFLIYKNISSQNFIYIIILALLPFIFFSFATLSRARFLDAIFITFLAYALRNIRYRRNIISKEVILFGILFLIFFIAVTSIRTDELLLDGQSPVLYSFYQIFDYFTKSVEFSNKYFTIECENSYGSHTFRFYYLLIGNIGINSEIYPVCSQVLSKGIISVFETPNFLVWLYNDLGILGLLFFCIILCFFAVQAGNLLDENLNLKSYFFISLIYLFIFKSIITYAFYDLWFNLLVLMTLFLYFIKILKRVKLIH